MTGGLNLYDGGHPSRRPSRIEAADARGIYREGRRVDLMEEVVFGIGQRNMQRGAMLHMQACMLAGDGSDPALNTILANIELDTLMQARNIQRGLFKGI